MHGQGLNVLYGLVLAGGVATFAWSMWLSRTSAGGRVVRPAGHPVEDRRGGGGGEDNA